MLSNVLVSALVAPAVVAAATTNTQPAATEAAAISAFVQAWDAADAVSLAQLFEPDGRLVIPTGSEISGQKAIRAFYSAVFDRGYRGSKGGATITRVTKLTDTLSLVEGEWSILNAKRVDGSARAPESGQFSAIMHADAGGWRLIALREMNLSD